MFYFEGLLLFLIQQFALLHASLASEKVAIACIQYELCIIIHDVSQKNRN